MTNIFYPGHFYHIYNRGNNRENIFYKERNYKYFLEKFDEYLSEYIHVYAFCLLPNHFHFLIRIPEKENDAIALSDVIDNLPHTVTEKFRRFFLGYSQTINKQQHRVGSLFQKNFKRKLINKEEYLTRIIYYIYLNPIHHKRNYSFESYPYSSYRIIVSNKQTKLLRKEVINIFGSKRNFIDCHQMQLIDIKDSDKYLME